MSPKQIGRQRFSVCAQQADEQPILSNQKKIVNVNKRNSSDINAVITFRTHSKKAKKRSIKNIYLPTEDDDEEE